MSYIEQAIVFLLILIVMGALFGLFLIVGIIGQLLLWLLQRLGRKYENRKPK